LFGAALPRQVVAYTFGLGSNDLASLYDRFLMMPANFLHRSTGAAMPAYGRVRPAEKSAAVVAT
jgi:hypothetical protein